MRHSTSCRHSHAHATRPPARGTVRTPAAGLASAALLLLAAPALAGDGRIEINQASALAGGITPGDAPGFPVTLDQPGSYVLTGPLSVPSGQAGLIIAADAVTVELNGFGLTGPISCTGSRPSVDCDLSPLTEGIGNADPDAHVRSHVHGGFVEGFVNCVNAGRRSRVDGLSIEQCAGFGVSAPAGTVTNTEVHLVAGVGIQGTNAAFARIQANAVSATGSANFAFARAIGGNACDDASCSPRGARRFYLTPDVAYEGDEALLACDAGFHMASLFEILDPSQLHYDTTRGEAAEDAGQGPPTRTEGWVRTGKPIGSDLGTGGGRSCNGYTNPSVTGTTIELHAAWESGWLGQADSRAPWWKPELRSCGDPRRVWCVED